MNKLRKPQNDFTQLPNALLRDERLSLKAKGLFGLLYSKPDDWTYIEEVLVAESADGRDSFRSGIKELSDAGWIMKAQVRVDGVFSHTEIWLLHEPAAAKPVDGSPVDGEPNANNTDLNNTPSLSAEPKPTKASSRANPRIRLEQYLRNVETACGAAEGYWRIWVDSLWLKWSCDEFNWVRARVEFEWADFYDYWTSGNAAGGGLKADWPATWRQHCRRVAGLKGRGPRPAGGTSGQGGRERYDPVAAGKSRALAELFGIGAEGHGRAPAAADTCPFADGGGEGPTDAVYMAAWPSDEACQLPAPAADGSDSGGDVRAAVPVPVE